VAIGTLDDGTELFIDAYHFADAGSRLIAQARADQIDWSTIVPSSAGSAERDPLTIVKLNPTERVAGNPSRHGRMELPRSVSLSVASTRTAGVFDQSVLPTLVADDSITASFPASLRANKGRHPVYVVDGMTDSFAIGCIRNSVGASRSDAIADHGDLRLKIEASGAVAEGAGSLPSGSGRYRQGSKSCHAFLEPHPPGDSQLTIAKGHSRRFYDVRLPTASPESTDMATLGERPDSSSRHCPVHDHVRDSHDSARWRAGRSCGINSLRIEARRVVVRGSVGQRFDSLGRKNNAGTSVGTAFIPTRNSAN
jgi:hypothetical protein